MRPRRPDNPNQETLITIAAHTGQMEAVAAEQPEQPSVNIIEQKIGLMSCLSFLGAASMREGLIKIGSGVIKDRYGDNAQTVVAGAEAERVRLINTAKWSFARAVGQPALVDSGFCTPEAARRITRSLFSDFLKAYYGPRHHKTSVDYVKTLSSQVTDLQTKVASYNRTNNLRPHKVEPTEAPKKTDSVSKEQVRELQFLDTRSRMQAILYDPRAQFMPLTNLEKNQTMSWLDYMDNPIYPLGVSNQLYEIAVHQQRIQGATFVDGVRAMESKVWEAGDLLADAAKGYRLLTQLKQAMGGISPRVSLTEEFGDDNPALAYLLRYENVRKFVDTGEIQGVDDPLRVVQSPPQSQRRGGTAPGKRKTIYDQFTAPRLSKKVEQYLEQRAADMTVGQAHLFIDEAIANELNRAKFISRCLDDMENIKGRQRVIRPVEHALIVVREQVVSEPLVQLLRE